ncbi:MAG: hypothetical protein ACK4NZ_07330 [Tsuneonella sp.]
MNRLIIRTAIVALAGISLGACSSYGPGGYGYSRFAVGVGSGYYSDPYYGWYDGFYYPGSGYYVWDRQGYRHRWSDRHRHYWENRRGNRHPGVNWGGYQYRRLGDYRAPVTRRYRDDRPYAGSPTRYRDQRGAAENRREYRDSRPERAERQRAERPHAERPRASERRENNRGQRWRNRDRKDD